MKSTLLSDSLLRPYLIYIIISLLLIWSSVQDIVSRVSAYKGVDLSAVLHNDDWNAYMKAFSANPVDFAVIRIYNDNATVVGTAPKTIIGAYHAGIKNISLYMFPCIAGSRWTAEKGLKCPPATEQLDEIVHFLRINGIQFKYYHKKWSKPTRAPTSFAPTLFPTLSGGITATPTYSPTTTVPSFSPTAKPTAMPTWAPTAIGMCKKCLIAN